MVVMQPNIGKKRKITVELIAKNGIFQKKDYVNKGKNNVEMEDFCQ
jgi:hypothetical protein